MTNKVPEKSVNLTEQNIEKLKELFPEILTDGNKIDFEKLQLILGKEVDSGKERYSFIWPGKREAIIGAQEPSKGTLRPNIEKSKNFDATENLYIEGDNLEVLKLLQKSYNNKVKVIYIDPPYNTGKDFVYKDNFRDGVNNYLEQTGQLDSEGNVLSTNYESNGRFHTDWLNLMYPRLKLARNLLTNDGVIFISIDDREQANLKKICDEIFGESNFEGHIHWRRRHNQPNDKTKMLGLVAEHILVYAKDSNLLKKNGVGKIGLTGKFSNPDNDPLGPWNSKPWKVGSDQSGSNYIIETPDGRKLNEKWMGEKDTYDKYLSEGRIYFPKEGKGWPRKKIYLSERQNEGQSATNWWHHSIFGSNQNGTETLTSLFDGVKNMFSNPKPVELLKGILNVATNSNKYIVLDFFSGSASMAQATMELNAEDQGNRKFIMVQLPEEIAESFTSYKYGYKYINEIAVERIRRVGEKISNSNPDINGIVDLGFKYLSLDESNIKEWNIDFDNLEDGIDLFGDILVEGRNELDIVYEIMLKNGLELTLPINSFEINQMMIYDIAFGLQFICLADEINIKVAQAIISKRNEYGEDTISGVVFKDSGFNGNDSEKLNCMQLLKDAGFIEDNLQTI